MTGRRTKMDIVYDMLKAIQDKGGAILPTHLLYKSNLSHGRLKQYVEELKTKALVAETERKGKTVFVLTDHGAKFLADYRQLREFTDAFGL
ncbi:MAG: winged helix-turn-helix domain-containing protein [Candidatus Woesearchaeota archaeon]